jgi:hypothetical protein
MMNTISTRVPSLFILDNLESCIDLKNQQFLPEHAATEEVIASVLRS